MQFSQAGRDLTGWKKLLDLHESLYENKNLSNLTGRIVYADFMPREGNDNWSPINIKAGTDVYWSMDDDDLDHYWQIRRIDRNAYEWRALFPSEIDSLGESSEGCWIEINSKSITAITHKNDGQENESTLYLVHQRVENEWEVVLKIVFTHDAPYSDFLAMMHDNQKIAKTIEELEWYIGQNEVEEIITDGSEMSVKLPVKCLMEIDRKKAIPNS